MSRKRQAINMVTHVLQAHTRTIPPPTRTEVRYNCTKDGPIIGQFAGTYSRRAALSRTRRNAHARGLFEAARRENAFANCEHDHMIAVTRADTDTLVSSYLRPASFQMIITCVRSSSRDR